MVQLASQHRILLLELFIAAKKLEVTRAGITLVAQLSHAPFEALDVLLGTLADSALGLAVVGSFALELGSGQCGYTSGAGPRLTFLQRRRALLVILLLLLLVMVMVMVTLLSLEINVGRLRLCGSRGTRRVGAIHGGDGLVAD